MNDWHDELRYRRSVITVPVLWLAFVLSLFVHLAAMWEWLPRMKPIAIDAPGPEETAATAPISVRIANPASTPSAPQAPTTQLAEARPAAPPPAPRAPEIRPQPRSRPPPLTATAPSPQSIPAPPPPPREVAPQSVPAPPAPPPPAPLVETDLAAYIAARRRSRGEADAPTGPSTTPQQDEIARRDRIIASNLASVNTQNFGNNQKNSGGIFQIIRVGYTDAEFTFFGWNKDIRRRSQQRIEVRIGETGTIRDAVVRKMIAIIREYEVEDFTWESRRLGRNVQLSARKQDNAQLEAFLMKEFFDTPGAAP